MTDMPELLPCPFCGGEPTLVGQGKAPECFVYCSHCDLTANFEDIAIKKWNRRTDKTKADLSAAHHDISRLQGELKDALEDLREANQLLELVERKLWHFGAQLSPEKLRELIEECRMEIKAYRNKGQKL